MTGKLTTICGSMFSGKSTEILKRILWLTNGENKKTYVFKPSFDNRYSETEIVNHDGLKTTAISINAIPEIEIEDTATVFFDEVQFFTEPYFEGDIVEFSKILLNRNTDIVVAGLDMDWQGNPFDITGKFLAMADEVIKLRANCTVCGRPASRTYKKSHSGGSVELGSTDLYEARCLTHWSS